ncbi:MAG: O-antigen ligase family protein [Patescibacteria group bacterium]
MIDQTILFLYQALFFVTPLIMAKSTSELFEFNKILFIYISTILITFFWVLKMILNKKIILKKTVLDIPILVFLFSQVVSTVTSIDINTSIFGYYGRFNGGLLSIICYVLLYYGLVSNLIDVKKLLKTVLVSSLFVILWAIPGHFSHDLTCLLFAGQFNNSCWDNTTLAFRPELRAFSTLGQPNWLGAYLAIVFFIGIYYLIKNKDNAKYFILNTLYLFLNFSMILFSRSRSALLSVLVGLILFLSYYLFFVKTNVKKLLLILLVVTVIPILLFKTGEEKLDKFITLSTYQNIFIKKTITSPCTGQACLTSTEETTTPSLNITESFDIRKIVWEGAWKLAVKYPIFGTGVETFAYSYNLVRPVEHNLTSEWDYVYNKAHNEYLNFLATTGFVGLGSYVLLIGFFIYFVISKIKYQKSNLIVCLLIGYFTILITNFFGFSTTTVQLFFYLIPAFIFLITDSTGSTDLTKGSTQRSTPTSFNKLQIFFIFLLFSSIIYLLFSTVVYYMADVNYSLGTKYAKIDDQQKAAAYLEKAIQLRKEPVYEDRFSSTLAYLSALATLQNQKDMGKQIAVMSDSYNRELVKKYPKNVFYWKTRAKNMFYFYQVTNNENEILEGIQALQNARKLSPTDPKISYSLALYYSTLYDSSKDTIKKQSWKDLSLSEIDKTIELKSNFREAYLFKGQLLKKYGQTSEAKRVFEYILKNFNKNDPDVLKELQ